MDASSPALSAGTPATPLVPPALVAGPLLGAAGPEQAWVWARASAPGSYTLSVHSQEGLPIAQDVARASLESDLCLEWHLEGLDPGRRYPFRILSSNGELPRRGPQLLSTPLRDGNPRARLAFGSCSNDLRFPEQPIWGRMRASRPDCLVLLGDTPYIDSTELEVQRSRYQSFLSNPDVSAALAGTSWYAVWDDHDFGANDSDGRLRGKANSRRAFVEYHAGPPVGSQGEGIFTRFRRGPVEVFLLDTRWFAGVEHLPDDERYTSLLGGAQWDWLESGLRSSDAPFKLVACGMVWNGAVRPNKRDHWMNYPRERERLLRFIGEARVAGVVLIGGDIHRSRALRHATAELAGYDLTELISSPLANTVIEAANVPSPALLFDVGVQQSFLSIDVDARVRPARLRARCVGGRGEIYFEVDLNESELQPATSGPID